MASATSAPALFDGVQVVHSAEREDNMLSCGMHRRVSGAGAGKPVCSISGSRTSPQLMQRSTVPPVE